MDSLLFVLTICIDFEFVDETASFGLILLHLNSNYLLHFGNRVDDAYHYTCSFLNKFYQLLLVAEIQSLSNADTVPIIKEQLLTIVGNEYTESRFF